MRKQREALLIATLAGLVVVGAAAFVVQPTLAGNNAQTRVVGDVVVLQSSIGISRAG
ncbi:MAG: hypothetical protein ABI377_11310 [Devosia sp.]